MAQTSKSPGSSPTSRRGFLRGLTTLPLIGGSVALVGAPSAVAGAPSKRELVAYATFLEGERRMLRWELMQMLGLAVEDFKHISFTPGDYHFPQRGSYLDVPTPSTRARLVLASVGAAPEPQGGNVWIHQQIWCPDPAI